MIGKKLKIRGYSISTDPSRFDVALIHDFLRASYWAKDIPRGVVTKSIRNSLCFAVFYRGQQVGFARAITDRATWAYLADVFILPEHRGRGVGKMLISHILAHRDLQGLRRMLLATQDAHTFYQAFGFQPLSTPDRYLTIGFPNPYRKRKRNRR